MRYTTVVFAVLLLAAPLALAGCAADPGTVGPSTPSTPRPSASSSAPPASGPTETIAPEDVTAPGVTIPDDCRALISAKVLSEFGDIPLNDPAMGPSGKLDDGSLLCIWRDPQADTTGLVTQITGVAREPAMALLNGLQTDEGFVCYQPDAGVRCEKTWQNTQYPVTDGRTLYWRDNVLIDTNYSNLAPEGYTASIVTTLWGKATPTPTPSPKPPTSTPPQTPAPR